MSFLRKNALALVPVIAALLPVASHSQTREVKIYGFGAKSGVVRIFGLNSEAAMKAAAEQINKAGGVMGRPLQLIERDDESKNERGVQIAQELITNLAIQQYQVDKGHKDRIDWNDIGNAAKGAAAGGAALRLARAGLRVCVLERSVPGAEASSVAAGILGPAIEARAPGLALDRDEALLQLRQMT